VRSSGNLSRGTPGGALSWIHAVYAAEAELLPACGHCRQASVGSEAHSASPAERSGPNSGGSGPGTAVWSLGLEGLRSFAVARTNPANAAQPGGVCAVRRYQWNGRMWRFRWKSGVQSLTTDLPGLGLPEIALQRPATLGRTEHGPCAAHGGGSAARPVPWATAGGAGPILIVIH